jgi:acetyltransferase-like isoleucine patch superfamily enzyme
MRDPLFRGIANRVLQLVALYAPGETGFRPWLHRRRGVKLGPGVQVGIGALIETSHPELVEVGARSYIGIRTVMIAHFREGIRVDDEGKPYSIRIGEDVFIGPGSVILPNVSIGDGSVVAAGSVVSRSVPPMTMVQGNPAKPIAHCGVPLGVSTPPAEFFRRLKPIRGRE